MMYLAAAIAAYLIGSIPSGLILGKLIWHKDLRDYGSHNIGATNAWRTLGKGAGIAVFVADSLKGQAGVMLGLLLVGTPLAAVIGGLCAILGHSFSLFLRFHGGKGVATSLGVLTMLMGQVTFICHAMFPSALLSQHFLRRSLRHFTVIRQSMFSLRPWRRSSSFSVTVRTSDG